MTVYREIIRLNQRGASGRDIVKSCGCSRNTMARMLGKASKHGVTWNKAEGMTSRELRELFFSGVAVPFSGTRPDCGRIHGGDCQNDVTVTLPMAGVLRRAQAECRHSADLLPVLSLLPEIRT